MHILGRSVMAVAVGLACWLLLPQCTPAQLLPSNFSGLKAEMKVFETVIDGTMAPTFVAPFGLLEKTQGTYLPGFGLVFSLEVNLCPLRTPNPFDMTPLSKAELEKAAKTGRERVATIKESVPRLLADHAMSLHDLLSDNSVAVVVHLFEAGPVETKFPDQLVIATRKSDLDQYWERKISYQELVARMKVLEF